MSSGEDTVFDKTMASNSTRQGNSQENDERTVFDDGAGRKTTVDSTPVDGTQSSEDGTNQENPPSKKDKMKSRLRYAAGLGGAAVAGAGMAHASEALRGNPSSSLTESYSDTLEDFAADHMNDNTPSWSDGKIAVASGDFDDMSFSQAFAAARSQVGAGGAFEWHGKVYGTYLHDEWNKMSAAEKTEFDSHFSWSKNFNPIDSTHSDEITASVLDDADDGITANVEDEKGNDISAHIAEDADDVISVNVVNNANDGISVNIVGDTSEVEVLGVTPFDDLDNNIPVVSVDDNPIVMVDLDSDGIVEIAGSDLDDNGIITGNELIDINDDSLAMNIDLDSSTDNTNDLNMDMDMDMDMNMSF